MGGQCLGADLRGTFVELYDGEERAEFFTGERREVPEQMAEMASWMTLRTMSTEDEAQQPSGVYADLVYISDPRRRVLIRVRAVVDELKLESVRWVTPRSRSSTIANRTGSFRLASDGGETYRNEVDETISLRPGGTITEESFGIQHLRLYQVKTVALTMVKGESVVHGYMSASVLGKQKLVLRRKGGPAKQVRRLCVSGISSKTLTKMQVVRTEKIGRNRVHTISPTDVHPGDEVDVPVWVDVWFPPDRFNLVPFAFFSFDRLVVVAGTR